MVAVAAFAHQVNGDRRAHSQLPEMWCQERSRRQLGVRLQGVNRRSIPTPAYRHRLWADVTSVPKASGKP